MKILTGRGPESNKDRKKKKKKVAFAPASWQVCAVKLNVLDLECFWQEVGSGG